MTAKPEIDVEAIVPYKKEVFKSFVYADIESMEN